MARDRYYNPRAPSWENIRTVVTIEKYEMFLSETQNELWNAGNVVEAQRLGYVRLHADSLRQMMRPYEFQNHLRNSYQQEREIKDARKRDMRRWSSNLGHWNLPQPSTLASTFSSTQHGRSDLRATFASTSNVKMSGHGVPIQSPSRAMNMEAELSRSEMRDNSNIGVRALMPEHPPPTQTTPEQSPFNSVERGTPRVHTAATSFQHRRLRSPEAGPRQISPIQPSAEQVIPPVSSFPVSEVKRDSGYSSFAMSPPKPQPNHTQTVAIEEWIDSVPTLTKSQQQEWAAAMENRIAALRELKLMPEWGFNPEDIVTEPCMPAKFRNSAQTLTNDTNGRC